MAARITHVICGLDAGGTEMMCLRLVQAWRERFEQHVLVLAPTSRALEPLFRESLGERLILSDFGAARFCWLRSQFSRFHPDAVILHMFGLHHVLGAAAARSAGIKLTAASAGNPPPAEGPQRRRWSAVLGLSRLAGCPVVACSSSVERQLIALGVGLPRGSRPIPHGIDVRAFAQRVQRRRDTRRSAKCIVGMVARLDAIKDHITLVRAFALVIRQAVDAELWIVGEGPMRHELEAAADALRVSDSVRFLGRRVDVAELLGELDLYVFSTTRDEGFGIALIEAMAAGLPIIASDVPACREVLADGRAGVLVRPHDARALAAAIVSLLQDAPARATLAAKARTRVAAEYGIELCAERWENTLLHRDHSSRNHFRSVTSPQRNR